MNHLYSVKNEIVLNVVSNQAVAVVITRFYLTIQFDPLLELSQF